MTPEDVRAVFFKNYSFQDLNETLMLSMEEIFLTLIKEIVGNQESLLEVIKTIAIGKSRIACLMGMTKDMTAGVNYSVPMTSLTYIDELRGAVTDVAKYTRDNLETMDPVFRDTYTKENLESILSAVTSLIRKDSQGPANTRSSSPNELTVWYDFLQQSLIGIIGPDKFLKFAEEHDRLMKTLRQCQIECRALKNLNETRPS